MNDDVTPTVSPFDILSKIVVHTKYARYLPELQRRETWEEVVERSKQMMLKFFPHCLEEIDFAYKVVANRLALPSMRNLQFAGQAIEKNHARMFNCSARNLTDISVFSDGMFLLLSGSGFSYSVQRHHLQQLPMLQRPNPNKTNFFVIPDTIEGWADSIFELLQSYTLYNMSVVKFDYSRIRQKGAMLITSGGIAPGPEPLRDCHENIRLMLDKYLENKPVRQFSSVLCFDLMCYIAAAVRDGGIRRSATLALFSMDDDEMLNAKAGDWHPTNPQREMANISACMHRQRTTKEAFDAFWDKVTANHSGEPGIYFTNDDTMNSLPNPCVEAALPGLCNLTEVNVSELSSEQELLDRIRAATIIGTFQSAFTKFHYLDKTWQEDAENEPLLGVSLTGIASNQVFQYNLTEAANMVKVWNSELAKKIGIKPAIRLTLVKPSGTAALVLGTSSGVHSWHNDYYLRLVQLDRSDTLYNYLQTACPSILEDDTVNPKKAYVVIPLKAPEGAVTRAESPIDTLERVKRLHQEWILPGHVAGIDTHNVSCTVNVKDDQWAEVGEWLFTNRFHYNGVAVFPYFGCPAGARAPFEDCTKEEYERRVALLQPIDLSTIVEFDDHTNPQGESACAGGACELKSL